MASIFFIFGGVIKDVNAQTCGGGTTTIATTTTSQFATIVSNQCLNVTSLGSIIVPDGAFRAVNNLLSVGFIVNNAGTISTGITANGIYNGGTIESITNSGTISSVDWQAIYNNGFGHTIGSITNSGTISSTLTNAIWNNAATIGTITNTGTISSGTTLAFYNNGGTLATLNNSQGAGNSAGALTYGGALPTNYNIIINSPTSYGQLSGTGVTSSTAFGIYAGSVVTSKLYTGVLQGLTTSNVGATRTGTYSGLSWSLGLESGSASIWDLTFTGGSTADTQSSLAASASALQGAYTLQNTVLVNGFTYDCPLFDTNGVCISAGGRNTTVSANSINNTSGLLIGAYRVNGNIRVGAYVDQNLSSNTVNGVVKMDNGTPALGLFGVWSEKIDGTGAEVKVSAGYGQKNTTVTRQVVGTSEAGSGSSNLMSQGAQAIGRYGFAVMDKTIVSPYAGIRYTQNNMGGYTEGTSSAVTAPLTYSALNTNATTALAGVGASYKVIPTVTALASAGVETDLSTSNGSYSATGVTGLTPINFNPSPVRTRPTAMLGAYYDIEKNQRLGLNAIYRQEAYQAVSSTTVMATYTVGL